jgi:hypothetical protein
VEIELNGQGSFSLRAAISGLAQVDQQWRRCRPDPPSIALFETATSHNFSSSADLKWTSSRDFNNNKLPHRQRRVQGGVPSYKCNSRGLLRLLNLVAVTGLANWNIIMTNFI